MQWDESVVVEAIKYSLADISNFSRVILRRPLRSYQLQPARAILDSVLHGRGLTFAVMMSRQSGKNEMAAQLEAYLMNLFQQRRGATIVKASPTYKPQTVTSKMRLRDCLSNRWNTPFLAVAEGYIVQLARCRAFFFSAHPTSNVVGATATVLLECDEAQDVDPDKWNKDFAPMGASTNVTTVFITIAGQQQVNNILVFCERTTAQMLADGIMPPCIPSVVAIFVVIVSTAGSIKRHIRVCS